MNRTSVTLFFLLSVITIGSLWNPSGASAQYLLVKDYQPTTWIGLRVGTSIASESFDSIPIDATTGLKFGLTGGLDFEHWFSDTWGIATGLMFVQKGVDEQYAQSSATRVDTSGNDNFTMNYIEVPILLKMAFGNGYIRPFLFAGPEFGFLASTSEATDGNIPEINDLKSDLQNIDVSIYFGGGVMDRVDRGPEIMFDAGYEVGLTKVFKSEPPRPFTAPFDLSSAKSNEIIITVGLLWGI